MRVVAIVRRASRCRVGAAALALAFVAACSTLPAPSGSPLVTRGVADAFSLDGRFSLRQEERNTSGKISWRHAGASDNLLLSSPFGQGMAEIVADARGATLTTSDGRVFAAEDVETLTRQTLGYGLPLGLLVDWVRARAPAADVDARDALGRPLRLRRDVWRVAYDYDSDDAQALPVRIVAERLGEFELRLRVDAWDAPSADARQP